MVEVPHLATVANVRRPAGERPHVALVLANGVAAPAVGLEIEPDPTPDERERAPARKTRRDALPCLLALKRKDMRSHGQVNQLEVPRVG